MQEISDPYIDKSPLVSVLMITYNHAEYLAEAIESIINQTCEFSFELIIGEDASKDSTREIALAYQMRYPKIIRVIYSECNVGMNQNSQRIFNASRGKYIAYCEGDDYWHDKEKLSKQIRLITTQKDIGIVHSDWTKTKLKGNEWVIEQQKTAHNGIPEKYLRGDIFKNWFHPKILRTCTILIEKKIMLEWYSSGIMNPKYHFGDSVLAAWITERSNVGYISDVTAIYRVSPQSALRSGNQARINLYRSALEFDTEVRKFFLKKGNLNYPNEYRWNTEISLLLWGIKAFDLNAIHEAIKDIKQHFSIRDFIKTGMNFIIIRFSKRKIT